jgi:hypothetical protein
MMRGQLNNPKANKSLPGPLLLLARFEASPVHHAIRHSLLLHEEGKKFRAIRN